MTYRPTSPVGRFRFRDTETAGEGDALKKA